MLDDGQSSEKSSAMGTPPDPEKVRDAFGQLVDVVAQLRGPDGCPWDREQTLQSIKPYTLEETYELLEAIDSGDDESIIEEDAQICADAQRFDLIPVIERLTQKLIRRHPHVFGDAHAETPEDVRRHWERTKASEKQRPSRLSGIPAALPALAHAKKISSKAAKAGFDWPRREMLFDKLREEIAELAAELFDDGVVPDVPASVAGTIETDEPIADSAQQARIENELGDLLFVVANIARRWNIDPEQALRKSNQKFIARFQYIEEQLAQHGRDIREATLDEMEALYQQGKAEEDH